MSIAVYSDNSIIYPRDVYLKYNLYLISEYQKILYNIPPHNKLRITLKDHIYELEGLLDINNGVDIKKVLNITTWESSLNIYYESLNGYLISIGKESLVKIETFLRKEKLQKLNSL